MSNRIVALARAFWHDRSGATAVEYSVLAAFIFLVIVTPLQFFGPALNAVFEKVAAGFP